MNERDMHLLNHSLDGESLREDDTLSFISETFGKTNLEQLKNVQSIVDKVKIHNNDLNP